MITSLFRMTMIFMLTGVSITFAQRDMPELKGVSTRQAEDMLTDINDKRQLIEEALPGKAAVRPEEKRWLLIFDRNVNYGGHPSIPHANYALARMGEETGAYETVITDDTLVFLKENLEKFDAVFFNNTVGNLFRDEALRQNLIDFVRSGGGLLGVHGTTAAFTYWPGAHEDWPEFGVMLGARGAYHRESDEHVFIRNEDPDHPVNRAFRGEDFDYKDEFFRYVDPYSRDKVHVLLSIDTEKTDMNQGRAFGKVLREDNDYPVAWVRKYGEGRVFYCTIAHNPYVFHDPLMLEFYLDAIQYALGDLKVSHHAGN